MSLITIDNNLISINFDLDSFYAELLPKDYYYMCDEDQNILGIYTTYVRSNQTELVNNLCSLYKYYTDKMKENEEEKVYEYEYEEERDEDYYSD